MTQKLTGISSIPLMTKGSKETKTLQREFDKCSMCKYYNWIMFEEIWTHVSLD